MVSDHLLCKLLIVWFPLKSLIDYQFLSFCFVQPEVLIEKVNKFKQLTTDVELKRRQLVVLSLDASRVDAVQQLKGSCLYLSCKTCVC